MAKMFSADDDKWSVKIALDKKRNIRSSKSPLDRYVVIRKQKSSHPKSRNEKWYEEVKKHIIDSKKEVDMQARQLIDWAKQWQQKSIEQLDTIQRYISREHNLEKRTVNDYDETKKSTEVKRIPVQPKPIFCPSMPVLVTDTENESDLSNFLAEPPVVKNYEAAKLGIRRNTLHNTTTKTSVEVPVRKISRSMHSSALAISKKRHSTSSISTQEPEENRISPQIPAKVPKCETKRIRDVKQTSSISVEISKPQSMPDVPDIVKLLMETGKSFLAQQKEKEAKKHGRPHKENKTHLS